MDRGSLETLQESPGIEGGERDLEASSK